MQMSVKVTCILVLLALSGCFTPAISQIHFNRGWGASGSAVGKRGGSFKPMEGMALLGGAGCSLAITQLTDILGKLVQRSVGDVVACELGRHSGGAVTTH
ncbi:unnamed protein product [Meganyctiphanes norvegica]|uniref:Uncharacterized protein n=1 Tax=Meganyctiphanes norvegica TaxID=48144 RepID=A0AAV2RTC6_MEGNR